MTVPENEGIFAKYQRWAEHPDAEDRPGAAEEAEIRNRLERFGWGTGEWDRAGYLAELQAQEAARRDAAARRSFEAAGVVDATAKEGIIAKQRRLVAEAAGA